MADTKYSGLAVTTAASSNIWGVAQSGTSWAVYQSSVALIPRDRLNLGQWDGEPSSSDAQSTLTFYAGDRAGRVQPSWVDFYGTKINVQAGLFDSDIYQWYPTSAAAGQYINGQAFNIGTYSTALPVVGSRYTNLLKSVYRGSTAAANMTAGIGDAVNRYFRGSTAGVGGYFFAARFALDTFATSCRYFVGLTPTGTSAICTSNPSAMINAVGFGFDSSGTSIVFMHSSSGTATTEALRGQPNLATGNCYDAYIYTPPNSARMYYRIDDYNARSTLVNSSVAVHLPNVTAFAKCVAMAGQLNTSSGAARIGVVKLYAERIG